MSTPGIRYRPIARLCVVSVMVATTLLLSSCVYQMPEFDNPLDPANSGSSATGILNGVPFAAGASTVVEFWVPSSVFGGLGPRDFEPILYRADTGGELDFTGSLQGDLAALPVTAAQIVADGSLADWGAISPYVTDPPGDENEVRPGSDLVALYLAQDPDGALAVAFELADDSPNAGNMYVLHMSDSPGFGSGSPGFYITSDGVSWYGESVSY